jgi:hypothetical protein
VVGEGYADSGVEVGVCGGVVAVEEGEERDDVAAGVGGTD